MGRLRKAARPGWRLAGSLVLVLCCAAWLGPPAGRALSRRQPVPPRHLAASSAVAFVNVNVAPMDAERVLERQTAVVRDGRIAELGPAESLEPPPEAERIEAEGCYLMPGLADMHTHFGSDDTAWRNDLFLFVANGVTTVREMWGSPRYLWWRDAIASGAVVGPRLYLCSPGLDGPTGHFAGVTPPITTPEQARRTVALYQSMGYDFIKVYSDLTLDVYTAITEEARARGIRVVGHIPSRVRLANVLAAGQASVEHLNGFAELASSTGSLYTGTIDESRLQEIAASIGDAGVCVTPTLAVSLVGLDQIPAMLARPEMRYVSPSFKLFFASPLQTYPNRDLTLLETNIKAAVRVLHSAGVNLLLGLDSGWRYVLPGFSVHDELRLWVEAGLTPFQALRRGTAGVAEFLGAQDQAGTIAVGKRADLLLVRDNPLGDVGNLKRRVGVMAGGRWMSEEWLQERLEAIARSYGN